MQCSAPVFFSNLLIRKTTAVIFGFCFFFCRGAEAKEIVLLFQGKADLCLPGAPGRILGRALLETSELSLGSAWGGPTSPEVPCEPGCEEEGWKMGFPPHHRGWTLSVAPQRLR